jgi:RimJ/RimL family protein N-acetyltransferase
MREQDIALLTIADDRDPDAYRKLHAMSEEASQDVPTTVPHLPESFEQFIKWLDSPGIHRDRMWIARRGDEVLGVSVLSYPPVRGVVGTDWTATARSIRGKGVARALKLETLQQAMDFGVDRVRTGNDGQNEPILHLNADMGYTRLPGTVNLLKDA